MNPIFQHSVIKQVFPFIRKCPRCGHRYLVRGADGVKKKLKCIKCGCEWRNE